jgi:hypothetical protein
MVLAAATQYGLVLSFAVQELATTNCACACTAGNNVNNNRWDKFNLLEAKVSTQQRHY